MAGTVRDDIAECASAAYQTLSVAAACKMLMLPGPATRASVEAYVADRGLPWAVEGETIRMRAAEKQKPEVDALVLMRNTMAYATELERIV